MFTAQALFDLCHQHDIALPNRDFPLRATLHLEEVYRWNPVLGLTVVHHREATVQLTLKCLLAFHAIPPPARLVDLEAGAGFPGIVLALFWPNTRVTLCEPDKKRRVFLESVCERTGLDAEILEKAPARSWDMVTCGTSAPWNTLLGHAAPVTAPAGQFLVIQEAAPGPLSATPPWEKPRAADFQLPDGTHRSLISATKSAT